MQQAYLGRSGKETLDWAVHGLAVRQESQKGPRFARPAGCSERSEGKKKGINMRIHLQS